MALPTKYYGSPNRTLNPNLGMATMVRPANATQYSIGDAIANSMTGAQVVPIAFTVPTTGSLIGARCGLIAASGTIVLPKFDLLLFRPSTVYPFAAGSYVADNSALNIADASLGDLVAVFPFSDTGWRNQAGGATAAGTGVWQSVAPTRSPTYYDLSGKQPLLNGIIQAQNTWNPGNIANTFQFTLEIQG